MIHVRGAQEVHGGAPVLANQHARREVAALSLHGGRPFDSFQREPTGVQLVLRILDVGGAHPREGLRRPTMISVRGSSSSRWTFRIPSWAPLIKPPWPPPRAAPSMAAFRRRSGTRGSARTGSGPVTTSWECVTLVTLSISAEM